MQWVLLFYAALNLLTFVVYYFDKKAAIKNTRRISETTLLALGLFGGWPSAFLAQQFYRHKTRKIKFQNIFWLTVCVNISLTVWLWML